MNRYEKLFNMTFFSIYDLYLKKITKKNRTKDELDLVITWLTNYSDEELHSILDSNITLKEFFDNAKLNDNSYLITGVICGIRVEEISDPLIQKIRYLDKLVDELAKQRKIEKILR